MSFFDGFKQNNQSSEGSDKSTDYDQLYDRRGMFGTGGNFSFMTVIIIVLVVYILFSVVTPSGTCNGNSSGKAKLDSSLVTATGVYTNAASEWTSSSELTSQLEYFYEQTGVEAYIYDVTGEDTYSVSELETIAEDFYNETYTDQGHFVTVFQYTGTSYTVGFYVGEDAASVMDASALSTLSEEIGVYFDSGSISSDNVLPTAYRVTATTIMANSSSKLVMMIVLIVVLVLYCVYMYFKKKR